MEELVKKIEERKLVASKKPNEKSISYITQLGHIKRAKVDLEDLYLQYRKEVQDRCLFIVATGSTADKFADAAEKDFYCFQLDSDGFYKDLLVDVNARLYTDQVASPSLFDILGSTIEEKAGSIGVVGYPPLLFESKYKKRLKGEEDVLKLLKTAFNDKVGAEFVGLDAIEKVSKSAINHEEKERKTLSKFPIVLVTKDESNVKSIAQGLSKITGNVFIVGSGSVESEDVKNNCNFLLPKALKTKVEETLKKIAKNSK